MMYQLSDIVNGIIIGDSLASLKKIPSSCVRTIVTSPPYYGLRDYGTAEWTGGNNQSCDHLRISDKYSIASGCTASSTLTGGGKGQEAGYAAKKISLSRCKKCGAVRTDQQIGLESSPQAYVKKLVRIFRECRRILSDDGTLWLNIGDSYWGGKGRSGGDARPAEQAIRKGRGEAMSHPQQSIGEKGKINPLQGRHDEIKPKDLVGIPWMLAFALRKDGWYLRSDIIWHKPNPMPESVTDRPSKQHEYIFLLSKRPKYYYDHVAILQPIAESVASDRRLYDENYTVGRPDRNLPGNRPDRGSGLLSRKSGNVERKYGDAVGAPEGNGKHQGRSVPWEGGLANKKSVWTVTPKPFSDAHFATFPPDLIIDCVKAGTSQIGHCPVCGAVITRATTKELLPTYKASPGTVADDRDHAADENDQGSARVRDGHKPGYFNDYTTVGWTPTCPCDQGQSPAMVPAADIVLDPFMGAGTTALVAASLGRDFIGIDLNKNYVTGICVPRLQSELGMFYTAKVIEPGKKRAGNHDHEHVKKTKTAK